MNTVARLNELAAEHELSLFQLALLCGISYNTLKSTAERNGQLTVDTIERICLGLKMPMSEFFVNAERSDVK